MKKLLSIILAVVMVVSALTLCVAADEQTAVTVGYDASRVVKPTNLEQVKNILYVDTYPSETAYKVNSPEGLLRVATAVKSAQNNFAGVTIYLTKDVDMTGIDWVPIGFEYNKYFYGTFDGLGHIISNLVYDDSGSEGTVRYSSLFGGVCNATIKNVVVDNTCSFKYSGSNNENRTSGLVAYIHGRNTEKTTIDNCFSAATVNGKRFVGGILGQADCMECVITNTTFAGDVTTTGIAGGFGSYVYGLFNIRNCWNAGNITSTGKGTDQHNGAAGFISRALPKDTTDASQYSLENCINTGTIKGGAAAGILSSVALAKPMQIKNCTNYGNVVAGDGVTGAKLDEIAVVFDGQTAPTTSGNEAKSGQASGLTLPTFTPDYTAEDGPTVNVPTAGGNDNNGDGGSTNNGGNNSGSTNTPKDTTADTKAEDTTGKTEQTTADTTTEEEKGGCGSVIGGGAVAIVALAGVAFVAKKKKED